MKKSIRSSSRKLIILPGVFVLYLIYLLYFLSFVYFGEDADG
jgi:hypothetical protein